MRLLLLTTLLALGCQTDHHDDQPKNPAVEMAAFSERVQAADLRMHVRYAASRDIAIQIGVSKLDGAHAAAAIVDAMIEPDLLPVWRPYVEGIRDAAREVETTPDLERAARATSTLGMRCAQCHEASHAPVGFAETPRPAATGSAGMADHQWAALEMWNGLVGPAPSHWTAGAKALQTLPVNLIAAAPPLLRGDVDDVARIRMLATRAETAATSEARAHVFGDMLAACAHCHQTLRDR